MQITAQGRRVQVMLNETQLLDADLNSVTDAGILRNPGLARATGHIGFLGHGTRVDFRNIRIRPLQ